MARIFRRREATRRVAGIATALQRSDPSLHRPAASVQAGGAAGGRAGPARRAAGERRRARVADPRPADAAGRAGRPSRYAGTLERAPAMAVADLVDAQHGVER